MTDSPPNPVTIEQIEAELDKIETKKSNPLLNAGLLVFSIVLFAGASLLHSSKEYVVMLLIAVFIHETGHWLGMKLFGYNDVKMFFIPFIGAAVSGREKNPSGTVRAIVSLLGPAPGIIIGLAAGILSTTLKQPLLMKYGMISTGLNLLNMLPFFPLDGGHFFEAVLFSRFSFLEIASRLLAAAGLAALAWHLHSFLLGGLMLLTLFATRELFITNGIALRLRKRLPSGEIPAAGRIPHEQLEQIMPELAKGLPGTNVKPDILAARATNIWQKARLKAPRILPTLTMLACYAGIIFAAIVASLILIVLTRKVTEVHRTTEDGRTVNVQVTYFGKYKLEEAQLDGNGYYDGPEIEWSPKGIKQREGNFSAGFKNGEWEFYDPAGNLKAGAYYVNGMPESYTLYNDNEEVHPPRATWPASVRPQLYPVVSDAVTPRDLRWFLDSLKQRIMRLKEEPKKDGPQ